MCIKGSPSKGEPATLLAGDHFYEVNHSLPQLKLTGIEVKIIQ
jgi:hypothetical protein